MTLSYASSNRGRKMAAVHNPCESNGAHRSPPRGQVRVIAGRQFMTLPYRE
jgi:hypothetical protein